MGRSHPKIALRRPRSVTDGGLARFRDEGTAGDATHSIPSSVAYAGLKMRRLRLMVSAQGLEPWTL